MMWGCNRSTMPGSRNYNPQAQDPTRLHARSLRELPRPKIKPSNVKLANSAPSRTPQTLNPKPLTPKHDPKPPFCHRATKRSPKTPKPLIVQRLKPSKCQRAPNVGALKKVSIRVTIRDLLGYYSNVGLRVLGGLM